MRLICPSCGAQYEVDDSVIPETGRDVQCSNCGHAWFQVSAAELKAQQAGAAEADVEASEPEAPEAPEPMDVPEAQDLQEAQDVPQEPEAAEFPEASESAAEATDMAEADVEEEDDGEAEPPATVDSLKRRKLDDAVRRVLQEEAERERHAREAEGSAAVPQPDDTAPASVAADSAGQKAAEALAAQESDDDAQAARGGARRELLPDIEEIKSTLRATSDRGDEPAAVDAPETLARRQRSGFRRGFSAALLIAVLALGLYLLAPIIADAVPALEPTLAVYVAGVDQARLWLDGQIQSLTEALKGAAAGG